MPYADKAKELLMELKRASVLPSYNGEGVREVVNEINALHRENEQTIEDHDYQVGAPLPVVGLCAWVCPYGSGRSKAGGGALLGKQRSGIDRRGNGYPFAREPVYPDCGCLLGGWEPCT